MSEWRKVKLSEICVDGKGSYGIPAPSVSFSNNLPTYLRISDISDNGILDKSDLKSVDDPKSIQYILRPNDIVFARTGNSTGRSYFYNPADGELVYAGFLIKFSIDPSKVNPKYIKYYALSNEYLGWLKSFNTGSTRGNINAQTYASMEILLPPRMQQDLLVKVCSVFDDKIENNAAINRNLAEQAKAIFKSWFIDFEPFQDGEFIDSELGPIPKGWRVGSLADIVKFRRERIRVSELSLQTYISTENMLQNRGGITDASSLPTTEYTQAFEENDILISNIRPYFKKIWYASSSGGCSNDVICFFPKRKIHSEYALCTMVRDEFFEYMMAGAKGTKMPRGDRAQIMAYPLVIPPDHIATDFAALIYPMIIQIRTNMKENQGLSLLRDTLLPKLMSGTSELRFHREVDKEKQHE